MFGEELDGCIKHQGCLASCLLIRMENQAWENGFCPHILSVQVFLGQREIGQILEHVEKEKLKSLK